MFRTDLETNGDCLFPCGIREIRFITKECVYCAVRTEGLYKTGMNFSPQNVRKCAAARCGCDVGLNCGYRHLHCWMSVSPDVIVRHKSDPTTTTDNNDTDSNI